MVNQNKTKGAGLTMENIMRLAQKSPLEDIRRLYAVFDSPVTRVDCGRKCAPFNMTGKPFCCDICQAVPAVYNEEWDYLKRNTDLWRFWIGDECPDSDDVLRLKDEILEGMALLACKGPALCQRVFRALSCRQFPFFPYVTADYRFLGLAYEWEFEDRCWVISNLHRVSKSYRSQFVAMHDALFAQRQDIFENYAYHSERMRNLYAERRRRIPLLHRNGDEYRVSPVSGRLARAPSTRFPRFGPYRVEN